jgi:hypothetical protein
MSGEEMYRCYGQLIDSVRTGQTVFEQIFGQPVFPFFRQHPDKAAIFDRAMVSIHGRETAAMIDAYDFAQFKTLADVGGGNGSLLREVLQRVPKLRGILYDLPDVIERAARENAAAGMTDRLTCVSGSFLESVPAGADAYLLRHVIHDWDDETSRQILRNVRAAIGDGGKLLIIESVIPPGNDPCPAKLLDLTMLTMPGGLERTEDEYRQLLSASGFRLTKIVPTQADVSVIEAAPA